MPDTQLSQKPPHNHVWVWTAIICILIAAVGAYYYIYRAGDEQPAIDAAKGEGKKGEGRKGGKGGPGMSVST
jgi:hypothetical protein